MIAVSTTVITLPIPPPYSLRFPPLLGNSPSPPVSVDLQPQPVDSPASAGGSGVLNHGGQQGQPDWGRSGI